MLNAPVIWFAIGAIIGGIQFATSTDKNPSKLHRPVAWLVVAFLAASVAGAMVYGTALWLLANLLLVSLGLSAEFDLWTAH